MYHKLLLCQGCKRPYGSVEVTRKRQATTVKHGFCYDCNLKTLLATRDKEQAAKPKAGVIYNGNDLSGLVGSIMADAAEQILGATQTQQPGLTDVTDSVVDPDKPQQTFIPHDLSVGRPPSIPPLHMVADEPDVIEYEENGKVIYRWVKGVEPETGQKFYQDQVGNRWFYKRLN